MTFLLSLNKLINENKSMNLTLDESLTEGRLGLLTLSRNGSNGTTKTLQTPCCLLYTSTGSVPHLTPSILSSLPLSSSPHIPLCVSTESLLPMLTTPSSPTPNNNKRFKKDHRVKNNSGLSKSIHPSQAFTNAFSEGLGTYIGLDKTAILVTELRDLKGWLVECGSEGQVPGTGDGILTTTLAGGSLRVTPEEYAVTTLALCPDIILSLSDASSPNTGNTVKRGQRAVDRTLKALDVLLSTLQNETLEDCQSPVVLAALVGGNNPTLRTKCAVESLKRHGIGGVVVPLVATDSLPLQIRLESSLSHVPKHMVRVVLGCETLMDVIDGVACGGDVFDGVYADTVTSSGHALIVTFPVGLNEAVSPVLDLRDGKYSQDMTPLSHSCPCSTCHRHSKAYIHHILNVKEMLAGVLLMAHNLTTVDCVMRNVRESLKSGTFDRDREAFRRVYYSAS